jgi:hypothetical protein
MDDGVVQRLLGNVVRRPSSGPPSCIYIDPTTFDQSCNGPADCFVISTGKICTGACLCGGSAAINVGEQGRYLAEVNSIATDLCPCPPELPPICSKHRCVACTGATSNPPECFGPPPIDAGVLCKQGPNGGSSGGDAGVCGLKTSESCSDGTTYTAACTCPDATCTCSLSSGNGGSSSGGAPFKGCPAGCGPSTLTLAYEACGFPLPQ